MLKVIALISFSTFLSITASANPGWTEPGYVTELQATGSGRFIIKADLRENPSGCKTKNAFYMDYSSNGAEQAYQLLLQAIISHNPVRLHVTGACDLNDISNINSASIYAK